MESEAPPSAALYNFLGWLNANKKRVGLSIGLIVVVIAVLALTQWQRGQREIHAAEELSNIRLPGNPAELAAPDTAERLIKLAETYPKTKAADHARLLAGSTLYAAGEYAKAQAQFEKFLTTQEESPWIPQARYGIATCLDGLNKTNEALAKYEAFIKSHPNDPAAEHARLNVGRLLEQSGELAKAVARYNGMIKEAMKDPAGFDNLIEFALKNPGMEGQIIQFAIKNPGNDSRAVTDSLERLRELYAKNPLLKPQRPVVNTNTIVRPPVTPPIIMTNRPAATNAALVPTNVPKLILTNLPAKP